MHQIDPGRPSGNLIPLENQVPNQEIDGPRAMLPLAPVREQEHHDEREHAGLGHEQNDEMELENMLPLQQMVNLNQDDHMLEDGDARLREQNHAVGFLAFVGLLAAIHLPSLWRRLETIQSDHEEHAILLVQSQDLASTQYIQRMRSEVVTCSRLPGQRLFLQTGCGFSVELRCFG